MTTWNDITGTAESWSGITGTSESWSEITGTAETYYTIAGMFILSEDEKFITTEVGLFMITDHPFGTWTSITGTSESWANI